MALINSSSQEDPDIVPVLIAFTFLFILSLIPPQFPNLKTLVQFGRLLRTGHRLNKELQRLETRRRKLLDKVDHVRINNKVEVRKQLLKFNEDVRQLQTEAQTFSASLRAWCKSENTRLDTLPEKGWKYRKTIVKRPRASKDSSIEPEPSGVGLDIARSVHYLRLVRERRSFLVNYVSRLRLTVSRARQLTTISLGSLAELPSPAEPYREPLLTTDLGSASEGAGNPGYATDRNSNEELSGLSIYTCHAHVGKTLRRNPIFTCAKYGTNTYALHCAQKKSICCHYFSPRNRNKNKKKGYR